MEFVLAGEISPKLIVTVRSLRRLELPVTEPPDAPVIVGCPPLLISKVCASAAAKAQRVMTSESIPMVERRVISLHGAVTVNVTEIVVLPFSKNCGLIAKIAGTVRPLVLVFGTAFMMKAPLSAVVELEKALRFDLTAVNS